MLEGKSPNCSVVTFGPFLAIPGMVQGQYVHHAALDAEMWTNLMNFDNRVFRLLILLVRIMNYDIGVLCLQATIHERPGCVKRFEQWKLLKC